MLAHVRQLLAQVEEGSWDFAYADSVVGKLSSIAPVVVGGRSALAPNYQARTLVASDWPNPNGKTPRGARIAVQGKSKKGRGIPQELAEQCKQGLLFWEDRLSKEKPPPVKLFVFKDGSLKECHSECRKELKGT